VFEDKDWFKKIIIVALVSLIPIIGQIVALGFALEIMRRVINNDPTPLPEFDFGGFLGKGFQGLVIGLVYAIPLIILYLPIQIVPLLGGTGDNADVINYLTIGVSCICGGLAFIYSVLLAFLLPAGYGKFITEGKLGAAFRIGEVFGLVRKALVPYIIAILGTLVAGLIAPLGAIACGIGVILTSTYYFAIMGHFYGQAYKQAQVA
jgi:hypothetical protein